MMIIPLPSCHVATIRFYRVSACEAWAHLPKPSSARVSPTSPRIAFTRSSVATFLPAELRSAVAAPMAFATVKQTSAEMRSGRRRPRRTPAAKLSPQPTVSATVTCTVSSVSRIEAQHPESSRHAP